MAEDSSIFISELFFSKSELPQRVVVFGRASGVARARAWTVWQKFEATKQVNFHIRCIYLSSYHWSVCRCRCWVTVFFCDRYVKAPWFACRTNRKSAHCCCIGLASGDRPLELRSLICDPRFFFTKLGDRRRCPLAPFHSSCQLKIKNMTIDSDCPRKLWRCLKCQHFLKGFRSHLSPLLCVGIVMVWRIEVLRLASSFWRGAKWIWNYWVCWLVAKIANCYSWTTGTDCHFRALIEETNIGFGTLHAA